MGVCSLIRTAVNLLGETWTRNDAIHDRKGHDLASVWSDRDGNIFLPFDPNEAVTAFWQEAYSVRALLGTDRLTALSQAAYYYVRPAASTKRPGAAAAAPEARPGAAPLPALADRAEPARPLRVPVRPLRRGRRAARCP